MTDEKVYSKYENVRSWTRPAVRGQKYAVASGHHLATQSAVRIFEKGGNLFDAGISAGICLCVLQPDMVNFAGVAPIMVHCVEKDETMVISGIGPWPASADVEYFEEHHNGKLPEGILRTVVPGSPDSWLQALKKYGSMTFKEVVSDALNYAEEGFPMHRFLCNGIDENQDAYRRWPQNAEIFLPHGKVPRVGEVFYQKDLSQIIRQMIAAEEQYPEDREKGIEAARRCFYQGPIARKIAEYHQKEGSFLTYDDLQSFESSIEAPVSSCFGEYTIKTARAWCQGPVLLSTLNILENFDLKAMGHNTPQYIHTITEAFKLVYADRDAWYADPDFSTMPETGLISKAYARKRAALIDPEKASPGMPPHGDPWAFDPGEGLSTRASELPTDLPTREGKDVDTSYINIMDHEGNCFCAVPSDMSFSGPVVPETGMVVSTRGSQSWGTRRHASAVAAGKRPRLTPHPSMIFKDGKPVMIIGTPGGDVQCQAVIQVFLNLVLFGMSVQEAIEAPRFATFSYPLSFSPHAYNPGLVRVEERLLKNVESELIKLNHKVSAWSDMCWKSGGVCAILHDADTDTLVSGADPRRECLALAR